LLSLVTLLSWQEGDEGGVGEGEREKHHIATKAGIKKEIGKYNFKI